MKRSMLSLLDAFTVCVFYANSLIIIIIICTAFPTELTELFSRHHHVINYLVITHFHDESFGLTVNVDKITLIIIISRAKSRHRMVISHKLLYAYPMMVGSFQIHKYKYNEVNQIEHQPNHISIVNSKCEMCTIAVNISNTKYQNILYQFD